MRPGFGNRDDDLTSWPSFADVAFSIVGVLLLYLLTQSAISSQTTVVMREIQERQNSLRDAVERAVPPHLSQGLEISEDGNLQRYTFADNVLFDSGKDKLKPQGVELLGIVGRVFGGHVDNFSRIQIEGHTDNEPIRYPFPSNWELSSARATSVVRFLQERSHLDPKLLSATGYSEYHPVASQDTKEGRARNRRIELVVVYLVQDVIDSALNPKAPQPST